MDMAHINLASYLFAALAFLLFFGLQLTARREGLPARLLVVATLVSGIWSLVLAVASLTASPPYHLMLALDAVRYITCILFLGSLLQTSDNLNQLIAQSRLLRIFVPLALLLVVMDLFMPELGFPPVTVLFSAHLSLAVVGLMIVEQVFRFGDRQQKWALKPLCLAYGAQFAFDFAMFAEATLFNHLDLMMWVGRGVVFALTVPFLLISARRIKQLSLRIFVSRQVVYHSTLLFGAGLYLLLMAAVGYYIRFFGGEWGTLGQVLFFALALLLLASLFLSESLRRQVQVFITKHFYANRYDYRIEWLKTNQKLAERADDACIYQTALDAMATVAKAPAGILLRRSDRMLSIQAHLGTITAEQAQLIASEVIRAEAFCLQSRWIIDLHEFSEHPERYPELTLDVPLLHKYGIKTLVPMIEGEELTGFFALGRLEGEPEINWEDRDLFNTVTHQLATFLSLHEASEALAESKQFDAFNRMSAFLVHDLKNIVAQLNLIVVNAVRHKHNPEFIDDSLDTLTNAVSKMQRIMNQLKQSAPSPESRRQVALCALLKEQVARHQSQQPQPELSCVTDATIRVDSERFSAIIGNLIQNAQDATDKSGSVTVSLTTNNDWVDICVSDTGSGMSAQFINERLFKPFDTTKGNAGMGIGVYDARQFVQNCGGNLTVQSELGEGSCFTLRLPLHS
ncbi:PEP-CTERM system histidine kinase PrsK [Corallincola holothuriorum]|uniref:histidine kinase n=1 Tax=Corallincola holothuriorum TaxID=2282215 RepID=A0A368N6I1_9GAMM|nr:XrtA/PEP-CTERM system histidine kinase PrsK [Corallincola holothuriorum]RCU45171.1 PEP-CTERM system histidine kinase PrsK [Corallincola holothuriorum]